MIMLIFLEIRISTVKHIIFIPHPTHNTLTVHDLPGVANWLQPSLAVHTPSIHFNVKYICWICRSKPCVLRLVYYFTGSVILLLHLYLPK